MKKIGCTHPINIPIYMSFYDFLFDSNSNFNILSENTFKHYRSQKNDENVNEFVIFCFAEKLWNEMLSVDLYSIYLFVIYLHLITENVKVNIKKQLYFETIMVTINSF